jgi:hypothetical protein
VIACKRVKLSKVWRLQRHQDKGAARELQEKEHDPIYIDLAVAERVESFKFLGVHITNKLSWFKHTKTVVKRARQHLFPLRRLKGFSMGPQILKNFYSCTIESILTGCITAWYGNCSASDRKALQRVVCTAQYITVAKLADIQDLYNRRCQRKALKIGKYSSLPSQTVLSATVQQVVPKHQV